MEIRIGYVYSNDDGQKRLVVSVTHNASKNNKVVVWRTATCPLPDGVKSQGSSTLSSFIKWPTSMQKAAPEDWQAFTIVESMQKDLALAKQRIKYRKLKG